MFNPNTGLYLYKFWINVRRKKPDCISKLGPVDFDKCLGEFISENTKLKDDDVSRNWLVTNNKVLGDGQQIHLDYGRSGFGSRLIDGKTRALNYDRKTSDVEVVPLLSRVWRPKKGGYGIWAFQSFGQHSCNSLVLQEFKKKAEKTWPGMVFNALPIVPSYLETYQTAPVTAVTLKKKASGDAAIKQTTVGGSEEVLIDVKIASVRGAKLGRLKDLLPKFSSEKARGREFGGQSYDQAHATIDIEGRSRTVSLYGPSKGTGLIDLDGDVDKIAGHPKPNDFFKVTDDLILGVVKEIGFEQG